MSDDEDSKGELVTTDGQMIDLNALIPLGVQLIEKSDKQAHAQLELQKE